jgi:hypothetical protein
LRTGTKASLDHQAQGANRYGVLGNELQLNIEGLLDQLHRLQETSHQTEIVKLKERNALLKAINERTRTWLDHAFSVVREAFESHMVLKAALLEMEMNKDGINEAWISLINEHVSV